MGILAIIMQFLGGWFSRFIGISALRFLAFKVVAWALVVTILPVVLYNLFHLLINEFLSMLSTYGTTLSPVVVNLGGIAGYLAVHLKLPETIALIMSALIFRLTLKVATLGRI